jgi:putative glutamine amidotransferase
VTVHPWAPERRIDADQVTRRLAFADALLLPGGGDLDPRRYGQAVHSDDVYDVDPAQDAFDLAVAEWAIGAGILLLAVCPGCRSSTCSEAATWSSTWHLRTGSWVEGLIEAARR